MVQSAPLISDLTFDKAVSLISSSETAEMNATSQMRANRTIYIIMPKV